MSGTADRDQPHLDGRAAPARPRRAPGAAERRGPDATHAALAEVAHAQWYRVVATLMRQTGDLQLAEDAAQDAVADALRQWPIDGLPVNPAAWLTTVGRRRAIDRLRREQRRTDKEELRHRLEAAERERPGGPDALDDDDPDEIADDQLRLLFLCCHPALGHEAQIALTLRAVAGLPTPAIARAFLVPEATMAQRIVRAKRKIALAGIPFRVPEGDLVAERLQAVLTTIYLIFNEGYASTQGAALLQHELCEEAMRLGRVLRRLLPTEGEVAGLLALMCFTHARNATRVDAAGGLVLLEDQDRQRWDRALIDEGEATLAAAPLRAASGPYRLQAEIAAAHTRAASAAATDWSVIASLYRSLLRLTDSPVVGLNHAVAVSFADGPEAGLALVDELDGSGRLEGYHLLAATQADLLRRLGRHAEAREAYGRALAAAPSPTERAFLQGRLDGLEPTADR